MVRIIDYPPLYWPTSGWWLTAFGALIGALLLLFPNSTGLSLAERIELCFLLAIAPAIFVASVHGFRLARVFISRARQYAELHRVIYDLKKERDRAFGAVNALVREREEERAFRIAHCYYYQSTPMIVLQRKRGLRANVGDSLTVVDRDTGRALGLFRVTDDGGDGYQAKGTEDIDPLWLGYMVQSGTAHSAPPPGALAILLNPTGDE